MYLTYLTKSRNEDGNEQLVFPVSCILQNGSPRYFASVETARAISTYWTETSLFQPKKLTIGDAFEVELKAGFSTYKFDELNVKPTYELPSFPDSFQRELAESLDIALLADADQNYDAYALESLACHVVEKINGTPAMEMFRTSDVMQSLKRSRNSFARALSLTQTPQESSRLFSLLLNETSFQQGRELISAAIRSMQCIPVPMMKSILKGTARTDVLVDNTLKKMQRKHPLRAFSIENKLTPDLFSSFEDSIKHLRNGLQRGFLNENQAINLLTSQFPVLKKMNQIDLSDILHQTWNKNFPHQMGILKDMLTSLTNVHQQGVGNSVKTEKKPNPAVVPGRPSLRPAI